MVTEKSDLTLAIFNRRHAAEHLLVLILFLNLFPGIKPFPICRRGNFSVKLQGLIHPDKIPFENYSLWYSWSDASILRNCCQTLHSIYVCMSFDNSSLFSFFMWRNSITDRCLQRAFIFNVTRSDFITYVTAQLNKKISCVE